MSEGAGSGNIWSRALRIGALSFLLAALVAYLSDMAMGSLPVVLAFLVVLMLIVVHVLFDTLGTAVTAAEQSPLNAMAAKRLNGAKQALWLVRNADRVANFTNDMVGDVTSAVAGAAGTTVALNSADLFHGGEITRTILSLSIIGLVAGLAVAGKSVGKTYAIERATDVVFAAGRVVYGFERLIGRSVTGGKHPVTSKRRTT